ncbi:MAG: response regulator [Desulfobacterales bacterium]|nr:response regulator [Desulfobacterales bacterium]
MANILIIDDKILSEKLLSKDLSMEGHHVTYVEELGDAMEELRSCRPDIVLLDLYFEGFEGWDLLHRIKLKTPHLPVLIVTAYDNFIGDSRLAQADGYVIKDIFTDKLQKKVEEVLRIQAQKTKNRDTGVGYFSLEKLKARAENYDIKIAAFAARVGSIQDEKKDTYLRVVNALEQKMFWIKEDIKAYELIGENGWENFSKEIEDEFKNLEKDYRKARAILP